MIKREYSNQFETYYIVKMTTAGVTRYHIECKDDGVWASNNFATLKAAKQAIDNQEIYFD